MNKAIITTSWDDGSKYDLRLVELLDKYDIPATFYIPIRLKGQPVLDKKEIVSISRRFEVGAHTLNHVELTKVPLKVAKREITQGKEELESIIGRKVDGFCYPRGKTNIYLKQLVGFSGFKFARTTDLFATRVGDVLLMPTTVHAYDHNPLRLYSAGFTKRLFYSLILGKGLSLNWENLAKACLDYCLEHGGVYHLWGHSWEIEERGDWQRLERVLNHIRRKTDKEARKTNGKLVQVLNDSKKKFYESMEPGRFEKSYQTFYYKRENRFIIKYLTCDFDKKGCQILDLGSGTGRLSELFQNANYLGVDFVKSFIKFSQKKFGEANKKFVCGDVNREKLNLPKANLILLWGLPEDETNLISTLERITPFIKKGTRVLMSLHSANNPLFNFFRYIRTEFMDMPFPYTTYTSEFLAKEMRGFASKRGYKMKFTSFGVIPPIHRLIPGFSWGQLGATLIIICDKLN